MAEIEAFITKEEEQELITAIQLAERNTSGEIRVHLEKKTPIAPLERAVEVFSFLNMDKTKLRNGVLFYVAFEDKKFAICGGAGINELVNDTFWETTKELVISHFKRGEYVRGLSLGIAEAGRKLKEFFPYTEDDINELSDEISKG